MGCNCVSCTLCTNCIKSRINKLKMLSKAMFKNKRIDFKSNEDIFINAIAVKTIFKYLVEIDLLERLDCNSSLRDIIKSPKFFDEATFEAYSEIAKTVNDSFLMHVVEDTYVELDSWTLDKYLSGGTINKDILKRVEKAIIYTFC